jgi:hypothetical protein
MALLRLQNEADCLTSQLTKQSLKHQPSPPPPNRSYPYRASGLVLGSIWDGHMRKWINDRRYRLYIQS